jgi:hypothetical protein
MVSRALSLATVALLIGCCAAVPAWAQATNLEAGKSPSQIFAGTCTACHKGPRGLLKTVPAGSLSSFLRQHYTTSPEMATLLASFLVANGASDTRLAQPKDGKPGGPGEQLDRFGRRLRPGPQEAARPEAEPREAAKRLPRPPGEIPATDGQAPAQAAIERGPDGRKLSAKQRLSKRGRPAVEEPPAEAAKTDTGKEEPAKGEAAKEETPKSETAKFESGKPGEDRPETAKPDSAKPDSAKSEPPKETGSDQPAVLRADPVPPVTPAPAASPTVSAAVSRGAPAEPAAAAAPSPSPPAPTPAEPVPNTVTAAVPPPVAPAGPPAPPISQ